MREILDRRSPDRFAYPWSPSCPAQARALAGSCGTTGVFFRSGLGGETRADLVLDEAPNQTARALDEGKLLGETGLEQDPDAPVAGNVSHRRQRHVLGDPHVDDVLGLGEDIEVTCERRLDLVKFLATILVPHYEL